MNVTSFIYIILSRRPSEAELYNDGNVYAKG